MERYNRHGNKEVGGDISVAYAHETFDTLLESVCFNDFTADELVIGNTQKSFTVEVGHTDIDQYRVFKGVVGSSFNIEVNLDGVVQATFGMVGADMEVNTSPLDTDPDDAPIKAPFTHLDGTFIEGGGAVGSDFITSISLSIDNQLQANYSLGSDYVQCYTTDMLKVEGTLTAYFLNQVLLNKFLNEVESGIKFELDDGLGNTHTFELPRIKYTGGDVQVSDGQAVPITLPFVALYDSGINSVLKITRS